MKISSELFFTLLLFLFIDHSKTTISTNSCSAIPPEATICKAEYGGNNSTSFPNFLGHNLTVAQSAFMSYTTDHLTYASSLCPSEDLVLLICSTLMPFCIAGQNIPPCKEMCLTVFNQCDLYMKLVALDWPFTDCNPFPSRLSDKCVDHGGVINKMMKSSEIESSSIGNINVPSNPVVSLTPSTPLHIEVSNTRRRQSNPTQSTIYVSYTAFSQHRSSNLFTELSSQVQTTLLETGSSLSSLSISLSISTPKSCSAMPPGAIKDTCAKEYGENNSTSFPNFLGQNLTMAQIAFLSYTDDKFLYASTYCPSADLVLLVCSTLIPLCIDEQNIPPCQEMCLNVTSDCDVYMQLMALDWPFSGCDQFPSRLSDSCVDHGGVIYGALKSTSIAKTTSESSFSAGSSLIFNPYSQTLSTYTFYNQANSIRTETTTWLSTLSTDFFLFSSLETSTIIPSKKETTIHIDTSSQRYMVLSSSTVVQTTSISKDITPSSHTVPNSYSSETAIFTLLTDAKSLQSYVSLTSSVQEVTLLIMSSSLSRLTTIQSSHLGTSYQDFFTSSSSILTVIGSSLYVQTFSADTTISKLDATSSQSEVVTSTKLISTKRPEESSIITLSSDSYAFQSPVQVTSSLDVSHQSSVAAQVASSLDASQSSVQETFSLDASQSSVQETSSLYASLSSVQVTSSSYVSPFSVQVASSLYVSQFSVQETSSLDVSQSSVQETSSLDVSQSLAQVASSLYASPSSVQEISSLDVSQSLFQVASSLYASPSSVQETSSLYVSQSSVQVASSLDVSQSLVQVASSLDVSQSLVQVTSSLDVSQSLVQVASSLYASPSLVQVISSLDVSQSLVQVASSSYVSQSSVQVTSSLDVSQSSVQVTSSLDVSQSSVQVASSLDISQSSVQVASSLDVSQSSVQVASSLDVFQSSVLELSSLLELSSMNSLKSSEILLTKAHNDTSKIEMTNHKTSPATTFIPILTRSSQSLTTRSTTTTTETTNSQQSTGVSTTLLVTLIVLSSLVALVICAIVFLLVMKYRHNPIRYGSYDFVEDETTASSSL